MRRLSIRWRMTLWNSAAFAVVLIGYSILIYGVLRQTHYAQLDRALLSRWETLHKVLPANEDLQTAGKEWLMGLPVSRQRSVGLLDSDGNLIAATEHFPRDLQPPVPRPTSSPVFDSASSGKDSFRRLTVAAGQGDQPFVVMLLTDLEHVNEEMTEVAWALWFTVPVTLIVATLLAYFLARKALAPVEQLRRQADQITVDRLDQRLPIPNPQDELGMLGATINEMISRLEQSFQQVTRFTADASHELRTPLAIIRSEAELATASGSSMEDIQGKCESIIEECGRLAILTDQLLYLSREDARANAHATERVDLSELTARVVDDLRPWIETKKITLITDWDARSEVCGDPVSLRRVLLNLLENAVKFTPENGTVEITVRHLPEGVQLQVRDTGCGISESDLPRVFDRFYRGHSKVANSTPGSGLGLSIVKSIVTSHHGTVEITSSRNEGTMISILLPAVDR